jgi:sugar diacid utilization regulator
MASELQTLVDNLGDRLHRSVALDDRRLRLLAYNSHPGEVDELRIHSIMQRQVPQDLVDYLHSLGGFDKEDLLVHPAKPELGLNIDRIVMPVRYDGTLLGFLWLLSSDGPLENDQTDVVRQAAERAGQLLQRDHLLDELRQARIREHMRDLLTSDQRSRAHAAQKLIEEDLILAGTVTTLVVSLPHEIDQPLGEKDRVALAIGLEQGCRRVQPRSAIHLERADHGVVVVAHAASARREIDDLAAAVHRQVCATSGRAPLECYVGIGESRARLSQAYDSYLEARRASDVAKVIHMLGPVVQHSRLGIYSLLAKMPTDRLRHAVHPGLRRLLEYDAGRGVMINTLEVFFENASDMKRTAEQLSIHRASLHYRLRRIHEITQLDLSTGDDRLALHLGLKVARLIKLT